MKRIMGAALFFATLLVCLWHYSSHDIKPFRCETQKISLHVKTHTDLVLNANSTVIVRPSNTVMIYISGSIKVNDSTYLLNRKLLLAITPVELEGGNNTQIIREIIHPADNTPDKIWQNFLQPEAKLVDFYLKIKPLYHNSLLIQGINNPYMVCVRQD